MSSIILSTDVPINDPNSGNMAALLTSVSFYSLHFGICFVSKNSPKWLRAHTLTALLDVDIGPSPERR